ncbi:MAG: Flp family type IVb pilin [Nocardioides sp.]
MIEKLQFMTLMFINDLKTKHAERDERGATAVEYGMLVALIAAVIVVAVALLGTKINAAFGVINGQLT